MVTVGHKTLYTLREHDYGYFVSQDIEHPAWAHGC